MTGDISLTRVVQVLQEGKQYDCGEPSPFQAEGKENLASTAYRSATDHGHESENCFQQKAA